MDFDVRRLAADAGTLLSRAVQFTEEVLGHAERTELDAHLENLLTKAEATQQWTDKIMKQTEVLLQPNPNLRLEEFLYEKLEKMPPVRPNNLELLGECLIDSGHEFGPGTAYGNALVKCGEVEKQLGSAERECSQSLAINFISPLRNFIEGDCTILARERKLLQNKRLDLDAAKTRLKKAKEADTRSTQLSSTPPLGEEYVTHFSYMFSFLHVRWLKMWAEEVSQAETELRISQSEFDRQAEMTRLLLEGLSSTHTHHLRCLTDFVDTQTTYYEQCHLYMGNLQKQLGSFSSVFCANNNQPSVSAAPDGVSLPLTSTASGASVLPPPVPSHSSLSVRDLCLSKGTCKARVLYNYSAASSSELSLLADEEITVSSVPDMDSDWLMGERGDKKGKVPITYLQLQS
ncbi:endophilin-B1-like isoform X1 [Sardina pilchardus]|uniref:endophilin-B1-like isoform X1 n=1 Tax=Sardina pilchardus TaxID=27697 RepID=UPI002E1259B8